MLRDKRLYAIAALVGSFVLLYRGVLQKLVHDWATDDNYSHGFVVVPVALYFVWERRARLAALPVRPSRIGLLIAAAGIGLLLAGLLGAELFVSRVSMLGVLVGTIVFVWGWRHLGALAFPCAFLLLMIPIPAIIFNQIAFPLQLLASRAGETILSAAGIPVLREGNVIILANTTLEVAEACSGIRSLVSLFTLGLVYGYLIDRRVGVRALLAIATIPVAIVTNALRVAGTGIAAHYYGARAAEGLIHETAGFLIFAAAFALFFVVAKLIGFVFPPKAAHPPASVATFTSGLKA